MFGIIKTNDKRMIILKKYLNDAKYIEDYIDLYDVDTLILPFKGIDNSYYVNNSKLNINEILKYTNIRNIISGIKDIKLEDLVKSSGVNIYFLNENKEFIKKNSFITAEGIFKIIQNDINDSFLNLKILILGYGNLGKAIEEVFNLYSLDIYSINESDKLIINKNNNYINDIKILNYDIIINTIPYNIIDDSVDINNDCLIYDLASYPYGFAGRYKEKAKICPQIPGNIMFEAAGKLIYETIMKEFSFLDCK